MQPKGTIGRLGHVIWGLFINSAEEMHVRWSANPMPQVCGVLKWHQGAAGQWRRTPGV